VAPPRAGVAADGKTSLAPHGGVAPGNGVPVEPRPSGDRDARDRVRVCHVIATTHGGGWALEQLVALRERHGYEVAAILNGPDGPLVDRLRAAGIPCWDADFDFTSLPPFGALVAKTWKLAHLLRRERFDVVQTALWQSMLLGRLAAWLADVPVRTTMVAGPFHLDAPITQWMDGGTCWMESVLVGSCRSILDTYREMGVTDRRLALVYYGTDERRFDPAGVEPSDVRREYGWAPDTPLVGHVAWFYQRVSDNRWIPATIRGRGFKGHEELIRATPDILREFPSAKVLLIGGGWHAEGQRFMDEMKQLVGELGLQDSVIFTGARSDINGLYRALDVAVQPSLSESGGGTIESLLMECPTVATRVGGMPDLILDGQTGLLVNPADPADLARGICRLLRDPEYGRTLARSGRAHALRTATLSRTVADLDALYRRFLFARGRRRRGHRRWVSLLRLPVLIAACAYLDRRLHLVEYRYRPRWEAGWRPWRLGAWRRLPRLRLWDSPSTILFRHRLYCNLMVARGNAFSLLQRASCARYRAYGHGKSWYQRSTCALYRLYARARGKGA
jgi:glycosyltransferase involved in cell wall biosynthesis